MFVVTVQWSIRRQDKPYNENVAIAQTEKVQLEPEVMVSGVFLSRQRYFEMN